ncbi:LacI family DNA-binding transcriptional regulator [Streptacidiphilus jiangxiensis]|uniref:LacI family transcriptional regulator n=1 Tax=Streptacidiphilus jiangxiensis TaxID=235985 RepID=A0A1H7RVK5_STRJI|nr:LacI family DNA-binding transcriptional regulator [Streptacidiphilus jiangxiensis]SEL64321.1 LacI family transcriptional regulator [Streptacidiphilus jiangxiensis]
MDSHPKADTPPTIYDVARRAGVSIASVSRVLNGRDNPRPATRDRVLKASAELGFVPDGAARALSSRLKHVVGVVFRRVYGTDDGGTFADEAESLLFGDQINRGIEIVAQRYGYDLLVCSVNIDERTLPNRIMTIAGKCDGLILHDQVLSPAGLAAVARVAPVVSLAGAGGGDVAVVRSESADSMRELARHLVQDHGYRRLAYIAGHADSPDNVVRGRSFADEARALGAECLTGPAWQGDYSAAGGVEIVRGLISLGATLPRAIACANDQTALGVLYALAEHGLDVPGDIAVTGFDDLPFARHLRPQLTTVRQPIQEIGAQAFEVLHSMITTGQPASTTTEAAADIVLPTRLIRRESCGCPPDPATPSWRRLV